MVSQATISAVDDGITWFEESSLGSDTLALGRRVVARSLTDPSIASILSRLRLSGKDSRVLAVLLALVDAPEREELEDDDVVDDKGVLVGSLSAFLEHPPGLMVTAHRLARLGLVEGVGLSDGAWDGMAARIRPAALLRKKRAGIEPDTATEWYRYTAAHVDLSVLTLPECERAQLERLAGSDELLLVVRGEPGSGRHQAVRAIAAAGGGRGALQVTGRDADGHRFGVACLLARWWSAMVVIDGDGEANVQLAARFADVGIPCALVVDHDAPRVELPGGGIAESVMLRRPDEATRAHTWDAALSESGLRVDVAPRRLARAYPLGYGDIESAVREASARAHAAGVEHLGWEHLRASLAQHYRRNRPFFVQTVPTRARMEDVVLPADTQRHIQTLLSMCRTYESVLDDWDLAQQLSKGRGIVALLSGPPGTGKTLIAEALAGTLGRELVKVDFGTLVSKYVGETGKQLRQVFEATDPLGSVLLFDEVDSMLQQRTEARSSLDRHANMDTNLLLQHLELFDGIVLLTTNLDAHLDPALRRRITLHVRFEIPDEACREAIWRRLLPARVALEDDVDFEQLAETELSGGHIKNCIVRALNAAKADGQVVAQRHLLQALYAECRALGMVIRTCND